MSDIAKAKVGAGAIPVTISNELEREKELAQKIDKYLSKQEPKQQIPASPMAIFLVQMSVAMLFFSVSLGISLKVFVWLAGHEIMFLLGR